MTVHSGKQLCNSQRLEQVHLALFAELRATRTSMDGIAKAQESCVRFGRKPRLLPDKIEQIRALRAVGTTVPDIMKHTGSSKAKIYNYDELGACNQCNRPIEIGTTIASG